MQISAIHAYEIIASGGYPSVEAQVTLDDGSVGVASVPYGASAGSHEAAVLVDGDTTRYNGKGMLTAIRTIHQDIAPQLLGMDASNQKLIDQTMIELDGTAQKSKLGGNAILAVSLASARAAAASLKKPLYLYIRDYFQTGVDFSQLPQPMAVVIEGGKHADNSTDLQEYCFSVLKQGTRAESMRILLECYHALEKILKENKLSTNVGNEGAFAPNGISSNEAPFVYMLQAIERAGYTPGSDIGFSIDAAASEFFREGKYVLQIENRALSSAEVIEYFRSWLNKYPIVTLEDPLHEDDWNNWSEAKRMCDEHKVLLVGDDLTVTSAERLQKAIDSQAISSILIKLNQIGSLSETVATCMLAQTHGMSVIPSHRGGGETNDTAMIDLAVAVGGKFIKVGPTRGERVAKYNRLLEIERELRG
jgi:enolase